jgi:transcriptional regulator with XRE-family HTH domain
VTTATERAVNAAQVDLWRAWLVAARKLQGLSQRALASRLGIRQSNLCQWENGHITPSMENWLLWAGALKWNLRLSPDEQPQGAKA